MKLSEISVYIPKQQILEQGGNFLDILNAIPPEELKLKQRAIARIAPRLQYAVVPSRVDPRRGDVWDPPIHDAVDVILDKILNRTTIEPLDGFKEYELMQQKCLQNDIMQNHADYAGLFPGKTKGGRGKNIPDRIWKANNCDNYTRENGFQGSTFSVNW